ncbi:shikimate dehydrogenase [Opitutia bacterium]|nr:shikimate dehydrogenase [Opitutae bacterium]
MSAPETFTPATLAAASFVGPQLGVLGDPIAHSLSPAMHGAALAALGPTHPELAGWRYHRLHVTAAELPAALRTLHAKGFVGLNLTGRIRCRPSDSSSRCRPRPGAPRR